MNAFCNQAFGSSLLHWPPLPKGRWLSRMSPSVDIVAPEFYYTLSREKGLV
jgi:hypothetical protein